MLVTRHADLVPTTFATLPADAAAARAAMSRPAIRPGTADKASAVAHYAAMAALVALDPTVGRAAPATWAGDHARGGHDG